MDRGGCQPKDAPVLRSRSSSSTAGAAGAGLPSVRRFSRGAADVGPDVRPGAQWLVAVSTTTDPTVTACDGLSGTTSRPLALSLPTQRCEVNVDALP